MAKGLRLERIGPGEWRLEPSGEMRVPGVVFADETTVEQLHADEEGSSAWSALRQVRNVASLPGIVAGSFALPDVHPGYGFPIGGVGAFDLDEGVAVVGGVGFDINCGVRTLTTTLAVEDVSPRAEAIARDLFETVPAGLGSKGKLRLSIAEIDHVLKDGAADAIRRGFGVEDDLTFIEEGGRIEGADPACVSELAKKRQFGQVGTLGSGNHYVEVQYVEEILDESAARAYGLSRRQVVISIHTGSRALGHQIGQDYLKEMAAATSKYGLKVPERELVCAPIRSSEGKRYLAAVACGANCAFANRQAIAHLVRASIARSCGVDGGGIRTLYDIGHNNVKIEEHVVGSERRRLLVHRKGSTRAFGPGRSEAPEAYRNVGHPTLVGGTMGTSSYIMRGTDVGMQKAFGSGIHGAGRALSRKKAAKRYWGETVIADLARSGIALAAHSKRGVAEEAPGAYKDVDSVIAAAESSGINRAVARLRPIAVVKG